MNNLDEPAARASAADHVTVYPGMDLHDRTLVELRFPAAMDEVLSALGVGGTVAVQAASFPWSLGELLAARGPTIVPIDAELNERRCTKTDEEIERLRWCAHLTGLGQAAALRGARPGRSELELWADIRLAMESAEGRRMPVAGDLVSGIDSTAAIGGWPTDRVIREGDPILCDLAPRARGYWGDPQHDRGRRGAGGLRRALPRDPGGRRDGDRLRPPGHHGRRPRRHHARRVRPPRRGLPIHMGHSIGTSVHEWPRIVPGEPAVLREGMVLMLEPGAYAAGLGGVRLEWMYLVTASGNEVLSGFPHIPHR